MLRAEYTKFQNELDNALDGDRSFNEVYFRRRRSIDTQGLILSHMTNGIFYASDLHDEQVSKVVDFIVRYL